MEESGQTTVSLQKRHNFVHLGPCQAEKVKENIFPTFQKSESASADGKRPLNTGVHWIERQGFPLNVLIKRSLMTDVPIF